MCESREYTLKKAGLYIFSTYKDSDILKSLEKTSIFLHVTKPSFETENGAARWDCHPSRGVLKMSSQLPFYQCFFRQLYLLICLLFKIFCACTEILRVSSLVTVLILLPQHYPTASYVCKGSLLLWLPLWLRKRAEDFHVRVVHFFPKWLPRSD